jgi:hypothetical protein
MNLLEEITIYRNILNEDTKEHLAVARDIKDGKKGKEHLAVCKDCKCDKDKCTCKETKIKESIPGPFSKKGKINESDSCYDDHGNYYEQGISDAASYVEEAGYPKLAEEIRSNFFIKR